MKTASKKQSLGKKAVVTLVLYIISFFFGVGIAKVAKGQDNASSLLWKVSGEGIEQPSYIFGTIHITCEENFRMPEELKAAFSATELTMMELDMDNPNLMMEAQKYSVNPSMENFSSKLAEDDKAAIDKFFKDNYGAGLDQLGIMKPFPLIGMVVVKSLTCPTKSYEQEFIAMSKESDREIKGLETTQFQMTLFDDIPQEEQLEWLAQSVTEMDSQYEQLEQMMKHHQSNDLQGLTDVIMEDPQFADYADLLLYNRNKDWIAKITNAAKEQPTFFAVGAGHLATDNGVIALLKKEGYTVEPVAF